MMREAGIIPMIIESESSGTTIWRVVVGPASNASERAALLETVKGLGFADAYAVTN
ncbi:MAG: SPOR domain-containing protein [Paracoccaceae bacterium]